MNEYLDNLEMELRQQGIGNDTLMVDRSINNDDRDLKVILDMQKALGIEYSDEQRAILRHRGNSVILACAGSGKALMNGTKVLTFKGYVDIEDLKVGDIVFDHMGNEQVVLGVYPQGKKRINRVKFNTGDVINCCSEHLWTIKKLSYNHWEVVDTQTLRNSIKVYKEYIIPHSLDIFDGNYKVICSNAYFDLVRRTVVSYAELNNLIQMYESDNTKLKDMYNKCNTSTNGVKSLYNFCMADCYNIAKSEQVKNVIKVACEMFGMSTHYVNNTQYVRTITDIEETDEYAEMTCIKVSGMAELFLTEHCIPTHNTTISTHLIAKRIITGEIADPSRMVYMTYSKAGADEMQARMGKVMKKLGYNINIDVRTIHSLFLKLMRDFGKTNKVLNSSYKLVAEACKESGFNCKEDDVSSIISLMGYQINNLLSAKRAFNCVHNNIENLTLEQYINIGKLYREKKSKMGVIDFDDMQYQLYAWAVAWAKSDNPEQRDYAEKVRQYCRYILKDIYIDEAQDIGKIQFEILKAITTDSSNPNKLVSNITFIGDDDQCLIEGTHIRTLNGITPIENINVGELVLCGVGSFKTDFKKVTGKSKKKVSEYIVVIRTDSGRKLKGTTNHTMFIYDGINCKGGCRRFTDKEYNQMQLGNVEIGMYVPSVNSKNIVYDDRIAEVNKVFYEGFVYDIEVEEYHNFSANGILVHNCIYEWRGSDPNIIQCVGSQFNIKTMVLSTNYRCKNEIVDFATTGIKCNNVRYEKSMNAYINGGRVRIGIVPKSESNLYNMSKQSFNQIKTWIKNGVSPDNIAVLCRNNKHLTVLSALLLSEGIYYSGTDDMKVTKSIAYTDLRMLIELCDRTWKHEIVTKLFWKFNKYFGSNNLRQIAAFMQESYVSIEDGLWYICKHIMKKDIKETKSLNMSTEAKAKAEYAMDKIGRTNSNANVLYQIYCAMTLKEKGERFKALLNLYKVGIDNMEQSKDQKRDTYTIMGYVLDISETLGFQKMVEYLKLVEQYENGSVGVLGEKVTLSTIHSAKGREWQNVIMFACDNISEPSFDRIVCLKNSDKTSSDDLSGYIDEERRLFYVGSTRAKEELVLLTSEHPSVFLLESLGSGSRNQDIVRYALDDGYGKEHKEIIDKYILDKNSKYFYENK